MISRKGVTLLELIVALSMTSVVLGMIFFSWNYINKHIAVQKTRTEMNNGLNMLSQGIISGIKRSRGIIGVNEHEIELLSDDDTVIYKFDNDRILINDQPLSVSDPRMKVKEFAIKTLNNDPSAVEALLQISITVESPFHDTAGVTLNVETKMISSQTGDWGF